MRDRGGLARRIAVALLAVVAATTPETLAQQKQYEEVEGSLYPARHFYTTEILGLRLGMTPEAAIKAVASRGFTRNGPEKLPPPDEDATYFAEDGSYVSLNFGQEGKRRLLTGLSYSGKYTREEFADVEARRADLVAMLGQPTYWLKWVREDDGFNDRFHYAQDREAFDKSNEASFCFLNWKCATTEEGQDCREQIKGVGGVIVQGSFVRGYLHFSVEDYDRRVAELKAEPGFKERKPRNPILCPVYSVH